MRRKSLRLFLWLYAVFLAQTALILYLYEDPRLCECGIKHPHIPETGPSVIKDKPDELTSSTKKVRSNSANFSSIMYLEPLVEDEFPTITSIKPRIPHIIHQTYKDELIPGAFVEYVNTIVRKNPNWTYYFWTDESSRRFVTERFPTLSQMWENYRRPINKADAIRYLVLYEFGGFYADLDVECKRPLDNITMKYACIFPPEPFEQSVFRLKVPYLINNAIMLCRPKHPFLKQIIDTLHQYQPMMEQIDVAGPSFVTSQFIRYNNITADYVYQLKQSNESNSPYFYKGELLEEDNDAVYVPNTQYFINSLSQSWLNEKHYKRMCARSGTESIVVEKACNELTRRLSQKDRDRYAFTDHHWRTSYDPRTSRKNFNNSLLWLKELVKTYTIY